jgi:LuxR family transcriptional regulator, quorum-sensing system regulator BjaR1
MAAPSRLVFDLVDRIAAAGTIPEVWSAYLSAAGEVGLPYGLASIMPRDTDNSLHIIADALPKGCLEGYSSNGLFAGDLVAERARTSTSSFEWKLADWPVARMSPLQKRWREHCVTFGLMGGLCILDFRRGEDMLLAICGPDGKLQSHDRLALFFAGREALTRIREMRNTAPLGAVPLSQRERECLQWAAAGKTDWETSQILSLSEKTVNVYIDRAKTKFGVKTRAQAIILASKAGLIAN